LRFSFSFGKKAAIFFAAALALQTGFAVAASVRMSGDISFLTPTSLGQQQEISMKVHPLPGDHIVMDTSGNISIIGNGTIDDPNGKAGKITISNETNQSIDFISENYRFGHGIGTLKTLCSMDGTGKNDAPCNTFNHPTNIDKKTLYIGMDMTVIDEIRPNESSLSSFDMSVVYQ
jgi:hypothetical protein